MSEQKDQTEKSGELRCSSSEHRSFYAEYADGWSTPCCGIWMCGDIIENETICPYCQKTFEFDEDDTGE